MTASFAINIDLRRVEVAAREGAARGLARAAEHVLGVARSRVPIEEATLERSGAASVDESGLVAAVSFDTPYAVVQHEDMDLQHDAGRQPKYLESAFASEQDVAAQLVAAGVREEWGT